MNFIKRTVGFFGEILRSRGIIRRLAKNDLRSRFASSFLGIVWAFVTPLCTLLVMWFAFAVGLKVGTVGDEGVPYICWLAPAYLMWAYFSEAIVSSAGCLREYGYLVKRVNFNVSIIPPIKLLSSTYIHLLFIGVMLVINACYGYFPRLHNLQILYYLFCLMMFELGLGLLISSVTLFVPDVGSIVNILLQIGFWVTPIIWNPESFGDSRIVELITKANPVYYICRGYRESLIGSVNIWDHRYTHLYFWGITLLLLVLGAGVFRKLKPQFADVL